VVTAQWNWSKKNDSMFATTICTALFYTILFTLFQTEFFQYPDAFENWDGGVYLKKIHNKITQPRCYHYCFYTTDVRPNPNPISIIKLSLYFVIFNL